MRELTEADAGGEHAVGVGEEVVLRLPENRTTGYRWRFAVPPDAFVLEDDGYDASATGRPGAGGVRTVRLRATRAGTHRLGATLQRPWDSGDAVPPGLEFRVTAR